MKYSLILVLASSLVTSHALAGIPECNNLRLEDVGSCEVRASLECESSCEGTDIYNKVCATDLRTVCSNECTLSADATCTDSCTEVCTSSCDRGENVICIHNCFTECSGSCEADCAEADDPGQCVATCEANCDGECDVTCKPLVDGDCYTHCVECCGGSCTASANMDCQQSCQEEEFETCRYEVKAGCEASCDAEGALFCDGEFALAGEDIPGCVEALIARGLAGFDVEAEVSGSLSAGGSEASAEGDAAVEATGCSLGAPSPSQGSLWGMIFAGLGFAAIRRRRAQNRN